MAASMHKVRLGRSLASLIGEEGGAQNEAEGQRVVALDSLKAGKFNPRPFNAAAALEIYQAAY